MRESVIDVLYYLFDDLLDEEAAAQADITVMADRLSEAGFAREDVGRAMHWFGELSRLSDVQTLPVFSTTGMLRVFAPREAQRIDARGQDYLRGLLRAGKISPALCENIISCALALDEPVDEATLCWVTAMVVLNVSGSIDAVEALGLSDLIEDSVEIGTPLLQ